MWLVPDRSWWRNPCSHTRFEANLEGFVGSGLNNPSNTTQPCQQLPTTKPLKSSKIKGVFPHRKNIGIINPRRKLLNVIQKYSTLSQIAISKYLSQRWLKCCMMFARPCNRSQFQKDFHRDGWNVAWCLQDLVTDPNFKKTFTEMAEMLHDVCKTL